MTFGVKPAKVGSTAVVVESNNVNSGERKNSSQNKQDLDSNATLDQWRNQGLLKKTNNESNSPTGQSSNFHFSQWNYEISSRNPSMIIENSSNIRRTVPNGTEHF